MCSCFELLSHVTSFQCIKQKKNNTDIGNTEIAISTLPRTEEYYELKKCFKRVVNVKMKGIINPSREQDCNFQSI